MSVTKPSKKSSKKPSLVFMGSGPVAAESLRLLSNTFPIEAVITKPSTEHEMSAAYPDAPVITVSSNQELEDAIKTHRFKSKVCVLIDFGIIVSQTVIDSFEKGIVNSHFSLLPELRGADPISFAILEGKKETGVSLMLVVAAMDEGDVLAQHTYQMQQGETTPSLTEKLIIVSYDLLCENLEAYVSDTLEPKDQDQWQKQNGKTVSYTRKLKKSDGIIDWNKDAAVLEREIRAYAGWPRSRTKLADLDVIITSAHAVPSNDPDKEPGDIEVLNDDGAAILMVECGAGYLCIDRLIPAGKKEMAVDAFLRGYSSRL